MPTFQRRVTVELGEITEIVDQDGNSIIFDDFDNLYRCSGIDLTGKYQISYEPEIPVFIDSEDPAMVPELIPYTPYENLIANIATLQARKEDTTYGLSGQDLIDEQERLAEVAGEEDRQEELNTVNNTDGAKKLTLAQVDSLLETTYEHTDFDNATDFASLKSAIAGIFNRQRDLDRKIMTRIATSQH